MNYKNKNLEKLSKKIDSLENKKKYNNYNKKEGGAGCLGGCRGGR